MLDDSFDGLDLKLTRYGRDYINNSSHDELIQDCIKEKINYEGLTDNEMKDQLKKILYEDLDEDEIGLLNKEKPLLDKEIEKFNHDKIYDTE